MNFPWTAAELLSGVAVRKIHAELRRTQWLSATELEELQGRRLAALMRHATLHVPYYRDVFSRYRDNGLNLAPNRLTALPLLTRAAIQEHSGRLRDESLPRRSLKAVSSSGTSGVSLQVFHDQFARDYAKAIEKRGFFDWTGTPAGSGRYAIGTRQKPPNWWRDIGRSLRRHWHCGIVDQQKMVFFSDEQLVPVVDRISRCRPGLLAGGPSNLKRLAEYLIEHGDERLRPHAVVSFAENLTPAAREAIERGFGCRVYDDYGLAECGMVASECPAGNLHIHAERFIVEIVRGDGTPADPGESGEIVITDLVNFGFPLIRYATGDLGSLSGGGCACGRQLPLLGSVIGRMIDIIRTPAGHEVFAIHIDHVFNVFTHREIRQVQLFQPSPGRMVIRVAPGPEYDESVGARAVEVARQYLTDPDLEFGVEIWPSIPVTAAGKSRFYLKGY